MAAKNRITISLDDAEYRQIQVISSRNGVSASHVVREAVKAFLENRDRWVVNPNTPIKGSPNPTRTELDRHKNLRSEQLIEKYKDSGRNEI